MSPEPVDYLAIGHVTRDRTPAGPFPGGTVTYAALSARALGLRVGILTAHGPGFEAPGLEGIQIVSRPSSATTTFENIQSPGGRTQILHERADPIGLSDVPEAWRGSPIVHLGPVAREIAPEIARGFPGSFVGMTPQGWLRAWDREGRVRRCDWPDMGAVLPHAHAAVLSLEDLRGDERLVEQMRALVPVLVITEGAAGARIYTRDRLLRVRPPQVPEVDATGAGDVFAACSSRTCSAATTPRRPRASRRRWPRSR